MTRWQEELKILVGEYLANVQRGVEAEPDIFKKILTATTTRQACRDLIVLSISLICNKASLNLALSPDKEVIMNVGIVAVLEALNTEVETLLDTIIGHGRPNARYTCNA